MNANNIFCDGPQFRILSDSKIEELHLATLKILERTGVAFESQEALDLLGDAGADVSNPERVKIPSFLVERALRTVPKTITLYTREGDPAIVLNGQTGVHFGGVSDNPDYVDPYTRKKRKCYIEDIGDMVRLIDALPNIEFIAVSSSNHALPEAITDKMALLQTIINSSKPVVTNTYDVSGLKEMIDFCAIVLGGEKKLRMKPFFTVLSEPVSPLIQGKDAMEKSLLCAAKGIPVLVQGMAMAGATAPATFAGCLVTTNAEVLSQLVVLQLKNPGTPVIFGSIPSIMDMKTTICSMGAPEMSLLVGALTELSHYYKIPMYGTAGCTDIDIVDPQMAAEVTYQILVSALTGADLVHDVGMGYHATTIIPELAVFDNEIIDMVKVLIGGIEINDETLSLDLIERVGPRGNYISEKHTLKHFRKFWMPKIFDRSMVKSEEVKNCEELLNERTLEIIKTHQPKPLPEDVVKELKKVEDRLLKRVGLKEYPKRPSYRDLRPG